MYVNKGEAGFDEKKYTYNSTHIPNTQSLILNRHAHTTYMTMNGCVMSMIPCCINAHRPHSTTTTSLNLQTTGEFVCLFLSEPVKS